MKATDLLEELDELQRMLNPRRPFREFWVESGLAYCPRTQWGQVIPLAGENGIYLYVSDEDDVWYIGKGVQRGRGGIGRRTCAHLGPYKRVTDQCFPGHHWRTDDRVADHVRIALSNGRFKILTAKVTPDKASSVVEALLLWICFATDGQLPPLNRRMS